MEVLHEELERAKLERERALEEAQQQREEKERLKEENRAMRAERERLEKRLELLQEHCDQLSQRVSDLEHSEKRAKRQDGRRQARADSEEGKETRRKRRESSAGPSDEPSLQVEDLEPPAAAAVPPLAKSSESVEGLRCYISSEGMSLQRARSYLEQQSGSLSERQAMLLAARSSCLHNPAKEAASQELLKSLQQEANHLEQLRATVQKGQSLLEKKAERLTHLESSLAEELSYNDTYRQDVDKKVTFLVSDSDMSSAVDGHEGTDVHTTVPAKVQQLADSLQHISGQLNTVLEALGSLAQKKAPPLPSAQGPPPLFQPHPVSVAMPPLSLSQDLPLSSTLLHTTPRWPWTSARSGAASLGRHGGSSSSALMTQRLHETDPLTSSNKFSSGFPININGSPPVGNYSISGYTAVSEQVQSMMSSKSAEMDNQQLQSLIDGNKRWLETRRKDPALPLFTRYRPPSSLSGLVQLGLDESNQIKVYHY
ncbi:centrosomal protein of 164 kDa-like [Engraulis encrasicolus]|uniref:centrosomal protein of 164 kDa-like n=1 Tax=Engraulis encrasicolus TaxID=184585 RepID=UPI002FD619E1